VLVPIPVVLFRSRGTDDLLETIEKVKARPNPNLELLGVLVTLHDKRTTLAREVHEQIKKVFGPKLFETVINNSVRLEESPAYKESIFSFAPTSSGAIEYGNLCDEVNEPCLKGDCRQDFKCAMTPTMSRSCRSITPPSSGTHDWPDKLDPNPEQPARGLGRLDRAYCLNRGKRRTRTFVS